MLGGRDRGSVLASSELYSEDGRFRPAAYMNTARADFGCAALPDGTVLAAGGRTSDGGITNATEIYHADSNTWTAGPAMLAPRARATVTTLADGRVLFAGGDSSSGAVASLEVYDPATGQFQMVSASMAMPRAQHAAALLRDGRVLFAGGSDGSKALDTIEVFDPVSGELSAMGKLTSARAGLTATTLLNGRVLLLGGSDAQGVVGTAEILDPSTGSVKLESSLMLAPRRDHSAVLVPHNNTVLIMGGTGGDGSSLAITEQYIPWMNKFQQTGSLTVARSFGSAAASSRTGIVLLAGGVNDTSTQSVADTFAPSTLFTDQADYAPGQKVTFSGSGWQPGIPVAITITDVTSGEVRAKVTTTPDGDGKITDDSFVPTEVDAGTWYFATAVQQVPGENGATNVLTAQIMFHDAANIKFVSGINGVCGTGATQYQTAATGAPFGQGVCADVSGLGKGVDSAWVKWISPGGQIFANTVSASSGNFSDIKTPNASGKWTMEAYLKQTDTTPSGSGIFYVSALSGQLVFTGVSYSIGTNACSPANGIQLRDSAGNPITALSFDTTVTLSSSSSGGSFYADTDSSCTGTAISSVVIPAGSANSTSFYYKDGVAGSPTLTGTSGGLTPATRIVTIGQRATSLTVETVSAPYGSTSVALSATLTSSGSGVSGETVTFSLPGNSATCSGTTNGSGVASCNLSVVGINAATYATGIHAAYSGASLYAASAGDGSLTITGKPITVTADAKSKVYGEADPALSYLVTSGSLVGSDAFTGALSRVSGGNVGDYEIKQGTLSAGSNYTVTYVAANLSITAKGITITADAKSKTYGDADPALTYQITSGGLVGSDAFSGSLTRDPGEDVGTYAIKQGSVSAGANYTVTFGGANLKIDPRPITITADAASKIYGDADPATLTYKITSGSLVNGDALSGSLTRDPGENAASYAIKQGSLSASTNYALTFVAASFKIEPRAITITADAASKTYGDTDPTTLTYKITSGTLVNGDAFSGSLTRNPGETVGDYAIKQGSVSAGTNYTVTFVGANFKIEPRDITITADAASKTYGEADPATLTYKITSGSLVNGDAFSGNLTRDAGESVGDYAIKQGTVTAGTNYTVSFVGANFKIEKRPITITADAASKTYGEADPNSLTYQVTSGSLVGSDAFTGALTRDAGDGVGTYAIRQGTVSAGINYTLSFVGANLKIEKRPITITADAASKTYGDADPTLNYKITSGSLVSGDAFTGNLGRDSGENVGEYAINLGTLSNPNYTITLVSAKLTISARPITVTADAKSKTYGDSDPTLTYKITAGSLAFTDAFSGGLTRTAGEGKGAYAIGQGTLALSSNYALTFVGANFTITVRSVAVKADAKAKFWGDADPALTFSITSGSLAAGDSFTGGLTRAAGEAVAKYQINQGTLALSDNYSLTFAGDYLTVNIRPTAVIVDKTGSSFINYDCRNSTLKATVLDTASVSTPLAGVTVSFTLASGGQSKTVTGVTDANGVATVTLMPVLPQGSATLTAGWAGDAGHSATGVTDTSITIQGDPNVGPGPASSTLYTGSRFFWTTNSTSSTATLTLSAVIQDTGNQCIGDIRKATASFFVRNGDTGSWTAVAQNLPVGLVDPNDLTVGTASAITQYNLGKDTMAGLWVKVVVGGVYKYDGDEFNVPIVVAIPGTVNTLTAGGTLKNDGVASGLSGTYLASGFLGAGDGLMSGAVKEGAVDLTGMVTYTRKLTNPQGQLTLTIHSYNRPDGTPDTVEHTYYVKSNSISDMSQQGGTLSFGSKTNVYEITGTSKVGLDGGGTMQVLFTPYLKTFTVQTGSAGKTQTITCQDTNGCASAIVYRSTGGVWFTTAWGSVSGSQPQTVEKRIAGGSISIQ